MFESFVVSFPEYLKVEWLWGFISCCLVIIAGIWTLIQYKRDLETKRITENSQMNMDLDDQLRSTIKHIANYDGDIDDIMNKEIQDISSDIIKEDIFDILNIIHKACYYYKKTNRHIMNSNGFWKSTISYYASKPAILTAYKKLKKYRYHEDMVVIFEHYYKNYANSKKSRMTKKPTEELKFNSILKKHIHQKKLANNLEENIVLVQVINQANR